MRKVLPVLQGLSYKDSKGRKVISHFQLKEADINSPAELGRLTNANGIKQSTRIIPHSIIDIGLANHIKYNEGILNGSGFTAPEYLRVKHEWL